MGEPRVWRSFERTLNDGSVKKFKIQQITPDMYSDVVDYMVKYFLPEEPFAIATDILNKPDELESLKRVWTEVALPKNLSVICLLDDGSLTPEIVGLNLLVVALKDEEELPAEPRAMMEVLKYIENQYDIFTSFNVDAYLTGFGLSVRKKYRGMSIGTEILLARTQICRELGLKITSTIFATVGGQRAAEKAGLEKYLEINFKTLEDKFAYCKFGKDFKSAYVMNKLINENTV